MLSILLAHGQWSRSIIIQLFIFMPFSVIWFVKIFCIPGLILHISWIYDSHLTSKCSTASISTAISLLAYMGIPFFTKIHNFWWTYLYFGELIRQQDVERNIRSSGQQI